MYDLANGEVELLSGMSFRVKACRRSSPFQRRCTGPLNTYDDWGIEVRHIFKLQGINPRLAETRLDSLFVVIIQWQSLVLINSGLSAAGGCRDKVTLRNAKANNLREPTTHGASKTFEFL